MRILLTLLVLMCACSKKNEQAPELIPQYKKQETKNPVPEGSAQDITIEATPEKIESPKVEEIKKADLPQMEGFQAPSNSGDAVPIQTKPGDPPNLPQMGSENKSLKDPETLPPSVPGELPVLPRSGR